MDLYLIRHGAAGDRNNDHDDDLLRPLTRKGVRQAAALAESLSRLQPQLVLSSPYMRCVQTVEPLAQRVALEIDTHPALAEGAGADIIDLAYHLVNRPAPSRPVIVCSHGDVIPDLLDAIVRRDVVDLGSMPRCQKASIWRLKSEAGRFIEATYTPPPTV